MEGTKAAPQKSASLTAGAHTPGPWTAGRTVGAFAKTPDRCIVRQSVSGLFVEVRGGNTGEEHEALGVRIAEFLNAPALLAERDSLKAHAESLAAALARVLAHGNNRDLWPTAVYALAAWRAS